MILGQPALWHAGLSAEETDVLWFTPNTPAGQVRVVPGILAEEMSRYNAILESIAEQFGARFLDLDSRVPRTFEHFFDDCHYTDLGSHRVALDVLPVALETLGVPAGSLPYDGDR